MVYEFWNQVTDRKIAHERILTGHGNDQVLPPDVDMVSIIKDKKAQIVLDFGCGVGRNLYHYTTVYDKVHGYDFPNMTGMLQQDSRYETFKNKITLYNDWNVVKQNKYDIIFASIVFQHIDEKDLETYFKDISNMTDTLVIVTRWYLDDKKKDIFPILYKYFDNVIEPKRDRVSLFEAEDKNHRNVSEEHYRLVLRPRG